MPQIIPAVVAAISYVGASVTAIAAGTATLAQIATVAAVGIGAGVGGAAAGKLLSPQVSSQGANLDWTADPDEPLRFAFGRIGVKGGIKHAAVYGPDRMYVSFVCTVSAAGPIKSFVSFRAGDHVMSFDGSGKATNEPYTGEMWLSTRLGAQPDTALPLPTGLKNGAAMPGWGSSSKLSGSAGYLVTLGENSKRSAYDGQVPSFLTTIEGLFAYDPRLDSTVTGGSGSCRLNNPATWVWTENPILFALKWSLGLWEGPTGKGAPGVDYQVGGIGVDFDTMHLPSVIESINIAQSNAWKGAAWPSTDDDKAEVLDGFLQAGGASYAEIAGKIAFIHRAAARSPVFTVTGRDTAGPVEIDTTASRLNRINTIRPRYLSEDHDWEMTSLPEVTSSTWQVEDGQGVAVQRTRGVDYDFVPDAKQARELAALEVSHERESIRGRVPLRPYMDPEPGNCFIFDEADFALSGLKCFVLDVEDDTENDNVVVTFETETDGKYPYAYGQADNPPPPQELNPYDQTYVEPPASSDWTVTVRPPNEDGAQVPAFDVFGEVRNATATGLVVEWGLTDDPTDAGEWVTAYNGPVTATRIPVTGMDAGAVLYIAISYSRGQRFSVRTVFGPYTAGDLIALSAGDSAALARIEIIESDGYLSKGEKSEVILQYNTINGEYSGIASQALALGISFSAYETAILNLNAYLAALDPQWNDETVDTPIVAGTFRAYFETVYVAKQALLNAISADLGSDVAAALSRLDGIASDNLLTTGEKSEVIRQHATITGEYTGIATQLNDLGLTSALSSYNTAYSSLLTYLAGLSPAWNSLTADTPISGPTFRAAFNSYYIAREAARTAISAKLNQDVTTALAALSRIASDNWLTQGEKPEAIREFNAINNAYTGLATQATALGLTSALTTYYNAIQALNTYMAGLSPTWTDLTVDTPIVGATFLARFTAVYDAKQALENAIYADLGADISTALTRLDIIASDSWLSAGEKSEVILQYNTINQEYVGLATQANSLGITTELTNYTNAIQAMNAYLDALSPSWLNTSVDTPIVGTTFRTFFTSCYTTKQALQNAIAADLGADVATTLSRLDAIGSDSVLSRGEKPGVIREYQTINGEYLGFATQLNNAGLSTALTNYNTATTTLNSYLAGLSPTWNNTAVDTPINASTFSSVFVNYYLAKQAGQDALTNRLEGEGAKRPVGRSVDFPLTSNANSITIAAHNIVMETGQTIALPASTVSSLASATLYGVFWRSSSGYQVEVSPASSRMAAGRWIFLGWQATANVGGASWPAPATPPGGYYGSGVTYVEP